MRVLLIPIILSLIACGKFEAHDPALPPASSVPPIQVLNSVVCGNTFLTIGDKAFLLDLLTGDSIPMPDGTGYQGQQSCTWGICHVCTYDIVSGIPKEAQSGG